MRFLNWLFREEKLTEYLREVHNGKVYCFESEEDRAEVAQYFDSKLPLEKTLVRIHEHFPRNEIGWYTLSCPCGVEREIKPEEIF